MLPARTQRRGRQGTNLPEVLDQFQRDFDTIIEQFFEPTLERGWTPTGVEIWEDDQKVHIVTEMPGVRPDDIDITLENNILTIRGEKKDYRELPEGAQDKEAQEKQKQVRWHMRARSYGEFVRQFQLPTSVDESKVNASFKDGLLHIEIEKRAEVKPKKIEVKPE